MARPALFFSLAASATAVTALWASASNAPGSLTKFVDPLPIPQRIELKGTGPFEITIPISQFQAQIHRDLAPTKEWGYDGSSPGPTIEVERGQTVRIHWVNQLPATHILPSPKGADAITPDVRAVTHLHGADVTQTDITDKLHDNDGWPDAWTVTGSGADRRVSQRSERAHALVSRSRDGGDGTKRRRGSCREFTKFTTTMSGA